MDGFFIFCNFITLKKLKKYYVFGLILVLNYTFCYNQEDTTKNEFDLKPEELLQKLIQFESISSKEKDVIFYLEKFCQAKGLNTQLFSSNNQSFNITASLYPLSLNKPNILLFSHLDIVPAKDFINWKYPPFKGKIVNDTLIGRGAIDCKGLAVMQIYAILNYIEISKTIDLPYNITFLGVCEEENSGENGAKFMVLNHLKTLNPVVVFGEGGSGLNQLVPSYPDQEVFGISIAEKSSLWLRLEVNKKSIGQKINGHSAVPSELYANKRLLKSLINLMNQKREVEFSKISRKMFRDLGKMEGGFKGFVIKHINWIIFWPFVKKHFREGEIFNVLVQNTFVITSLGTINSDAINQVGSGAYAVLDCRLLPGTDLKKYMRKIQFALGNKVDVTILSQSPNSPASPSNVFFFNMQAALKEVYPKSISSPILFPASTDNNYFRQFQIPTFGIIPSVIDRKSLDGIHGVNENIPVKSIYSGIEVYKKFIAKSFTKN